MTFIASIQAPKIVSTKVTPRRRSVLSILLMAYIAELIFGGPLGISLAGISVRKPLMVVLLAYALIRAVLHSKISTGQVQFFIAVVFAITLWGVVIPAVMGTDMAYSVAEFFPLIGLLLIFPFMQAIREDGAQRYLEFTNRCIAIVAAVVIVAWIRATFFDSIELALGLKVLYAGPDGDDSSMYIGPMPDGSFRVMWIICLFFPFMLFYKNSSRLRPGWTVFYLLAIFASGTRSFMYASLFMVALLLAKRRPQIMVILVPITLTVLMASSQIFEGMRLFEIAPDLDSHSARSEQFFSLLELYADHPVMGAGFGSHADVIRSDSAPYSYELTYVALLAKLGTVGSALAVFATVATLIKAARIYKGKGIEITALTVSFFFITATNPYLLNFFGITILSAMLVMVQAKTMPWHGSNPSTADLSA